MAAGRDDQGLMTSRDTASKDDGTRTGAAGDSRPVRSNQRDVHPRLAETVRLHLRHAWRQPLHPPSARAFGQLEALRLRHGAERPVVLDSGCGTGVSTRRLAECHPGALVIGVDRSAARLARVGAADSPRREGRVLWVRAELETLWRLARAAQWPISHHYLLYPNPSPKAAQLARRWHGHPVFPELLALGGQLELRSNWALYLQEFALAVALATGLSVTPSRLDPGATPLSPFEAKYAASGHALWRLFIQLPKTSI